MSEAAAPRLEVANGLKVRRNETFPIRHLYFLHGVSVQDKIIADNSGLVQQKGSQGVNLIVCERPLVKPGHGAVDEVPNGRSKRPRLNPAPSTLRANDARAEDAALLSGRNSF